MDIKHKTVARSDIYFYGWPANNGAWQWGDEFLFGVTVGKRDGGVSGKHKVAGSLFHMLVRSENGGRTWSMSVPLHDYGGVLTNFSGLGEVEPWPLDISDRIIRVCGYYGYGGDVCPPEGAFYSSADHGHTWSGPHPMEGLDLTYFDTRRSTSRTRVFEDLVFLSHAKVDEWGTDRVLVAKMGHDRFTHLGELPVDIGRQVMPAVAELKGVLYAACRRRYKDRCWIDVWSSVDGGKLWNITNQKPIYTGNDTNNGNPPALLAVGDKLVLAYGHRDIGNKCLAVSDGFDEWHVISLRSGGGIDFGYPQLFQRSDGTIVCVYYWYGGIESTTIQLD